jgi:hypothetical protein
LTSIFALVDAGKFPRKISTFKRWQSADCVESIKRDFTQSSKNHLLKEFIFLDNSAESFTVKMDVNKLLKKLN